MQKADMQKADGQKADMSKSRQSKSRSVKKPIFCPTLLSYIPLRIHTLSSGLRGHKRTYLTILELADHALFKMERYVLLRPLRPELDAKTKTCLPAKSRFCHLDEQANS
jgi:hypothetical protein